MPSQRRGPTERPLGEPRSSMGLKCRSSAVACEEMFILKWMQAFFYLGSQPRAMSRMIQNHKYQQMYLEGTLTAQSFSKLTIVVFILQPMTSQPRFLDQELFMLLSTLVREASFCSGQQSLRRYITNQIAKNKRWRSQP